MEIAAILVLVEKAMSVISTGIAIGSNVMPAVKVIEDLLTKNKAGSMTDADLASAEALLDSMISDFNQPIE